MSSSLLVVAFTLSTAGGLWLMYINAKLRQRLRNAEQQTAELEDVACRAQMNPHFLHNCLSNINAFIHQLDPQTASNYLTCLSRLMRQVLEQSDKSVITLARELDMITKYIKLEKLRFSSDLIINVATDEAVQTDQIAVPPLFIQPFLENAILHGVLPKQGRGIIDIHIQIVAGSILRCTITDNGVGRHLKEQSLQPSSPKRSMGIDISRRRIELFNKRNGKSLPLAIHDLRDENDLAAGTSIEINLKLVRVESDFD